MRKQYHFWTNVEGGVDAWDVDRLIDLSAHLQVVEVPLQTIWELDTTYWFDDGWQRPTVRKVVEHADLIANVDLAYPVILGPDGRVMDGMHRIARALLEDRETVMAVQLESLPEPDFRNCRAEELPYDRAEEN